MSEIMEILGVACLIAFAYVVWPPLALAAVGVSLLVFGVALDGIKIGRGKQ